MRTAPLLAAESIGKSFGRRQVLQNASLWVRAGEITALVGRNGEGKSTLLKIACGLMKPDFGVIRYGSDRFVRTRLPTLARRGLFFLPERSLISPTYFLRDYFRALRRRVSEKWTERAIEWLKIEDLLDRRSGTFSGGELRRAEIALAVARRPDCLLADEPFLGITPKDAEVVTAAFRGLAKDGCGIAVTGHEVPTLLELADEVLWMNSGTTEVLGTVAKARTHHRFNREYLGTA